MASNPYQVKFTLRQHTPIIHFQWHEKDATIRPTELKAKLDKWIIQQLSTDDRRYGLANDRWEVAKADARLKKWLRGATNKDKTKPALNYTVKILALGQNICADELNTRIDDVEKTNRKTGEKYTSKEIVDKDYAPYFGNQLQKQDWSSGNKRIKRLAFHTGVKVVITSQYDDLLKEIKHLFPVFLLKNNFGTRQGKGFGSFFLDKSDPLFPHRNIEEEITRKFDWKVDVFLSNTDELLRIRELFEKIELFYKTLRSGIHPRGSGLYFKSLMFQYVKDEFNAQWDKKTIKQKYFPTDETYQKNQTDNRGNFKLKDRSGNPKDPDSPLFWEKTNKDTPHLLWRDLLGLSSDQQWLGYNPSKIVKQYFPASGEDDISRLKSPIFFKPIRAGENVFRVFFEVPENIKKAFADVTFRHLAVEAEILGREMNIDTSTQKTASWGLKYPDTFDFDKFLKFALTRDLEKQVYNLGHRKSEKYKMLRKMKTQKLK